MKIEPDALNLAEHISNRKLHRLLLGIAEDFAQDQLSSTVRIEHVRQAEQYLNGQLTKRPEQRSKTVLGSIGRILLGFSLSLMATLLTQLSVNILLAITLISLLAAIFFILYEQLS